MADIASPDERLDILGGFADALPDPSVLLDRRSLVVHRNTAAAREFPEVSVGGLLTAMLRNPVLSSAIEAARRTDVTQTVELHRTVPNETWHRVHVSPLPTDGLVAVTFQSLTEERRMNQMRSDFIANASHELRTPLTSLVGFIDTLLGPAAKDEAARCTRLVRLATPGPVDSFNLASAVAVALTLFSTAATTTTETRARKTTRVALRQAWHGALDSAGFYRVTSAEQFAPRLQEILDKMDISDRDAALMAEMFELLRR